MSTNQQNISRNTPEATLYLPGISFDEKGQLLPFTDEMKELITQKYQELQKTLSENAPGYEVLSSRIIAATEDALIAKNVPEKKIKKFLKRVLEIYEGKGEKKKKKNKKDEKKNPKMMEEVYKQLADCEANTYTRLYLEYTSGAKNIILPVPIMVRSGNIDIEHIENSLRNRLSTYMNIIAKKK